jgi:hypothetical protein
MQVLVQLCQRWKQRGLFCGSSGVWMLPILDPFVFLFLSISKATPSRVDCRKPQSLFSSIVFQALDDLERINL